MRQVAMLKPGRGSGSLTLPEDSRPIQHEQVPGFVLRVVELICIDARTELPEIPEMARSGIGKIRGRSTGSRTTIGLQIRRPQRVDFHICVWQFPENLMHFGGPPKTVSSCGRKNDHKPRTIRC